MNKVASQLEMDDFLRQLAAEHRAWLAKFNSRHAKEWENLFARDLEGAMAEAVVRRLLEKRHVSVAPNPTGSGRQPDFICSTDQGKFYVDATCITIETVVRETSLPYKASPGFRNYRPLNTQIRFECKSKVTQCANREYPSLIAMVTFHDKAYSLFSRRATEEVLRSVGGVAFNINTDTVDEPIAYADLNDMAFLNLDPSGEIGFARRPVSGLLLCIPWGDPPKTIGILHPNPVRPFNPESLPTIPFCEVAIDRHTTSLSVRWLPVKPEIIDEGRGAQLSTSRITVQDLVPYFHAGDSNDEIRRGIPVLTDEEITLVRDYYRRNQQALDEEDRQIRERNAQHKNPEWVQRILAEARAERLGIMGRLLREKANGAPT